MSTDSTQGTMPSDAAARQVALRSEIDRRQSDIARAETDVGRAVWAAARAGAPPPPGSEQYLIDSDAAVARIAQVREQISALEAEAAGKAAARAQIADSATHCPACRAPRSEGARFCLACGHFLGGSGAAETALPPCDRCGSEVGPTVAFCGRCGWRVAHSRLPWWRARWPRVLVAGLVLYAFCQAVLPHTDYNASFIAAELVIGSLLVPLTFVVYFYERGTFRQTPTDVLVMTFVLGAVLGVAASAVLEHAVHWHGNWQYVPVGFIEEGAKAAVVVWWLRRSDLSSPDTGFVIGAATGMGFAVLETMGYALNAFTNTLIAGGGVASLTAMVAELNVRGALSPLGHGTWTGILAGVMWYERSAGRSPFGRRVVVTYVTVSLLHALFDISVSSHVMLVSFVSGTKVALPGLVFGLAGFATLLVMVRVVRKGGDPVATIVDRVQAATGGASESAAGS